MSVKCLQDRRDSKCWHVLAPWNIRPHVQLTTATHSLVYGGGAEVEIEVYSPNLYVELSLADFAKRVCGGCMEQISVGIFHSVTLLNTPPVGGWPRDSQGLVA